MAKKIFLFIVLIFSLFRLAQFQKTGTYSLDSVKVDSNPQKFLNIYECNKEDFIKATQRIYHDVEGFSHISIHVLN